MTATVAREVIPAAAARKLLLAGALLTVPLAPATRARVMTTVRGLGFVQIDSIRAVERAHHLILHARLDGYRPELLSHHSEATRTLFEHWTHDASLIRSDWMPWWAHRFERDRARLHRNAWLRARLGTGWRRTLAQVRDAIDTRGPLGARDFPRPARAREGWWDWSPHKAALELLWRAGELGVHSRRNFEKIYDRFDRLHPKLDPIAGDEALIDWACAQALARLGCATPRELAHFMNAVSIVQAREWTQRATRDGRACSVLLRRGASEPIAGVALPDWRARVESVVAPEIARALAPFDPLVRDRARLEALFQFNYRFEAFVPAARRVHGYYTMPVLQGERFIGRIDARSDREAGILRVQRLFSEGARVSKARRSALESACQRLAGQLGLRCELPVSAPIPVVHTF